MSATPEKQPSAPPATGTGGALPVDKDGEIILPVEWQKVQSAIWLLGLALLFFTGQWWPGILILAAVSGLTQALIGVYVRSSSQRSAAESAARDLAVARALALPANCPTCGAALDAAKIAWRSDTVAACPYCAASVPVAIERRA